MRLGEWAALAACVGVAGCNTTSADAPAPASASASASAPAPAPAPASASASAPAPASAPASAPAPAPASTPAPTPAPRIAVTNIGIHIGGGPNDPATKAPIASSVAAHMADLAACWAQVGDMSRGGDFGVDLLVPAAGGRAAVSHPRTSLGPDAFRDCVVGVFENVEFAKPLGGRTTASYALRFTPPPTP